MVARRSQDPAVIGRTEQAKERRYYSATSRKQGQNNNKKFVGVVGHYRSHGWVLVDELKPVGEELVESRSNPHQHGDKQPGRKVAGQTLAAEESTQASPLEVVEEAQELHTLLFRRVGGVNITQGSGGGQVPAMPQLGEGTKTNQLTVEEDAYPVGQFFSHRQGVGNQQD